MPLQCVLHMCLHIYNVSPIHKILMYVYHSADDIAAYRLLNNAPHCFRLCTKNNSMVLSR